MATFKRSLRRTDVLLTIGVVLAAAGWEMREPAVMSAAAVLLGTPAIWQSHNTSNEEEKS